MPRTEDTHPLVVFFKLVLKESNLCKSSILFLRHFIFAQIVEKWWLVLWLMHACFTLTDAMHCVATIFWKSKSFRNCYSNLQRKHLIKPNMHPRYLSSLKKKKKRQSIGGKPPTRQKSNLMPWPWGKILLRPKTEQITSITTVVQISPISQNQRKKYWK